MCSPDAMFWVPFAWGVLSIAVLGFAALLLAAFVIPDVDPVGMEREE